MWFPGGGRDERPRDRRIAPTLAGSNLLDNSLFPTTLGGPPRPTRRPRSEGSLVERLLGGPVGSAGRTVTCIACGRTVDREDAREYDRKGDRWDRENKTFEYLCKPCHGDLNHQPRDELEGLLVEIDAGERSREEFLEWYCVLVEERYGPLEDER